MTEPTPDAAPPRTDWSRLHGDAFHEVRVLVTGGAGFIGSHITEALIDLGARVVVLDDLSGGDTVNLDPFRERAGDRLRVVEGSILDEALLADCVAGCRWVFHEAALGSVPASVEQPRHYHQVNATGTLNVLEAARAAGTQRVLFAASSAAYGDSEAMPKTEDMAVLPKSPYAATKVAGEALMRAFAGSYDGFDTASLRYFNIFGPRQNANSAYAAVIAAFAKALGADEPPLIFGDGEQSRDFAFVDNVVHANLLAARHARPLGGEVFNVACGERVTVNELARTMAAMVGKPHLEPSHQPPRAGDVRHSLADLARIREAIGYEPIVDYKQGLAATVRWYQNEFQVPGFKF
ncbi:MAG: NAD-dependent epimerase/dehydratase family protein [Phycisphaeraceae bacterium]